MLPFEEADLDEVSIQLSAQYTVEEPVVIIGHKGEPYVACFSNKEVAGEACERDGYVPTPILQRIDLIY